MTAERVEALLSGARAARRAEDGDAVLVALDAAWELARELVEHPLTVAVAWKRAKAVHDFGDTESLVDCLTPIVGREDLFDAYPHGVLGASRVCRAHQDAHGFGHPTVIALWRVLADHHREAGDRYQSAGALLEIAWDAACRGVGLDAALRPLLMLKPSDLSGSASRHPEAPDAMGSLHWLHLDAAHTALRGAVWSGDADEAAVAADDLRHAAEELPGRPRAYVEHALLEAAHHGFTDRHEPVDVAGTPFDAAFTAALRQGTGFAEVAEHAPGPEWRVATRWCGVRSGEVDVESVTADAQRYGCTAFLQAISSRSSRTDR